MQPLPNSSSRRSKEVIGPESYTCGAPVVGGGGGGRGCQDKGLLKIAHSAALWNLWRASRERPYGWRRGNPLTSPAPAISSPSHSLPQHPRPPPTLQSRINCDRLRASLCSSLARLPAWSKSRFNFEVYIYIYIRAGTINRERKSI